MAAEQIAAALERVAAVLRRRPETGLHDDAPATARWDGGTRVTAQHANGREVPTDMPIEFGGSGEQVTPGWLFRAGLAACATTSIALQAARDGLELRKLEVRASSQSDSRGMFGMADADGTVVSAAPGDVQLQVRIAADGVAPERLRALVERAVRCSPIPGAVQRAIPLALHVEPG